jgi:lipase chaperone LimK
MPRKVNRTALALLGLAVLAGAMLAWWQQGTALQTAARPVLAARGERAPFVPSMVGTVADGDLQSMQDGGATGPTGALAYGELRRLFDYYLSAVGEKSVEAISQQIRSELDRRLAPPQAKKAQRLLALYIEFKRELVRLESEPQLVGNGVQAIRGRLLAMQDLRAHYFSAAETEGMFGFDDAYDMDAIARLEISQNPALSAAEKQKQYAALDAAMPATLREQRDASSVVVRVEQQAQDLRAQGASEDDIYRMRAKAFDPQAAARLADVDREELAWKARIARYVEERNKLLQSQSQATPSERQTALTQLQQSLFSEEERPRLAAYE